MREYMAATGRYAFHPHTEARSVDGQTVIDDRGHRHDGELVLVRAGVAHGGLVRELAGDRPTPCAAPMMQTEPLGERLSSRSPTATVSATTQVMPGRHSTLQRNESQVAVAREHRMQLLCVQRLHGGLTIGDTHEYEEPFVLDVSEGPYAYLVDLVEQFLGRALPPIRQRMGRRVHQCVDPHQLVCRTSLDDGVWVITGPGVAA